MKKAAPLKRSFDNGSKAPARPPVDRVTETLRGPVVDVFIGHVPAFRGMTREQAYELILNNPILVEECFRLFRKKRQLFHKIAVGPDGRPIAGEDELLFCGRTLAEVVAMVVRATANRYFHAKLSPPPVEDAAAPAPPGFWRRLLGRFRPAPVVPRPKRKATRADSLYRALRNFLLYEWQLRLIPHYVPLPVSLVRSLGPRILEFREPHQLRTLLLEGVPPPVEAAPAEPPAAPGAPRRTGGAVATMPNRMLGAVQKTSAGASHRNGAIAKADAMWKVCQALDLKTLFNLDEAEMRRTVAHASGADGELAGAFTSVGVKFRERVVVLCTIERGLGHSRTNDLFASGANPKLISAFAEMMRKEGIAAMRDPANLREATDRIISHLKKTGHLR